MSDKTFRQTVEKILFKYFGASGSAGKNATKDICEAVLKMAEGMPKPKQRITRYCAGCDVGCEAGARFSSNPAHDSEVAKQAVKEFAEKVIIRLNSEYTYGGIGNKLSRGHNEGLRIASEIIRAMAEGR